MDIHTTAEPSLHDKSEPRNKVVTVKLWQTVEWAAFLPSFTSVTPICIFCKVLENSKNALF